MFFYPVIFLITEVGCINLNIVAVLLTPFNPGATRVRIYHTVYSVCTLYSGDANMGPQCGRHYPQ